jgi:SnoaL-like protein
MTELERLVAIEAIKQLKARYCRCMDTKDWAGFEAVFAPDAVLDFRWASGQEDETAIIRGASGFAAFVRERFTAMTTIHHGSMPEIDLTSSTTARGIWAMEDILFLPAEVAAPVQIFHGYGHYHETYERIDGGWRIKTRKLTRLRVDVSTMP